MINISGIPQFDCNIKDMFNLPEFNIDNTLLILYHGFLNMGE